MNVAIIGLFIIPAIVTIALISLMIKEKDYLFPRKSGIISEKQKTKLEGSSSRSKRYFKEKTSHLRMFNNDNNFLDFSGGSFGI